MTSKVVVKAEIPQDDGEILLFYVHEDDAEHSEVVTVGENVENFQEIDETVNSEEQEQVCLQETDIIQDQDYHMNDGNYYVLDETATYVSDQNGTSLIDQNSTDQNTYTLKNDTRTTWHKERWNDKETQQLITFYLDNKQTFNGTTRKKDLWQVACNSIITTKSALACEIKLRNMKRRYIRAIEENKKNKTPIIWTFFDQCKKMFADDPAVKDALRDKARVENPVMMQPKEQTIQSKKDEGVVIIRKININRAPADKEVETMLQLYLKYKERLKDPQVTQKAIWDTIAAEINSDSNYCYKRFLNFKQHYIRSLEKRDACGANAIQWPYMEIFDKIFANDAKFQEKHNAGKNSVDNDLEINDNGLHLVHSQYEEWDETEMTVLVKYYFDCVEEFHDPTITNNFLWNEIGRLLEKEADACMKKLEQLKQYHIDNFEEGARSKDPIAILFDNIICKEVDLEGTKTTKLPKKKQRIEETWNVDDSDQLVQFYYDNVLMFKDPICKNVSWARLARKLNRSIRSCREQWNGLKSLYKNILNEKKQDSDMEIDWRYIEMFDRIFDYGTDLELLEEETYERNRLKVITKKEPGSPQANESMDYNEDDTHITKGTIKSEPDLENNTQKKVRFANIKKGKSSCKTFNDSYNENMSKLITKGGDPKGIRILNYYYDNHHLFANPELKKNDIWSAVAEELGLTPEQCSHRFRNFKQVYFGYLKRENENHDNEIAWPYYDLCKKVFGCDNIAKDFNGLTEDNRVEYHFVENVKVENVDDSGDWSPRETKKLLYHYAENYEIITRDYSNLSPWSELSDRLGRSEKSCYEKLAQMRALYFKWLRKKKENPKIKITWRHFNIMKDIISKGNIKFNDDNAKVELIQYADNDDDSEVFYAYVEEINDPDEDGLKVEQNM